MADDKGRILAQGGSITLSPDSTVKLYPHQMRFVVATIVMTTGTIPTDGSARIVFSGTGFKSLEPGGNQVIPVVITDPGTNKNGTATMLIGVDPVGPVNLTAQKVVAWTNGPPTAQPVSCIVAASDPTITTSGPLPTILPVASADNLTPSSAAYTTTCKFTVTDGGVGVEGYVVEWHEAGEKSINLFTDRMNAYLAPDADYTAVLTRSSPQIVSDGQGGFFVRVATNSSGEADLYLVSKSKMVAGSVDVFYDVTEGSENAGEILVVDYHNTQLPEFMPRVEGIEQDGKLHYDDLNGAPEVGVKIPDYGGKSTDLVYLVVNQHIIGAAQYYQHMVFDEAFNTQFPTAIGYSDIPPSANKENEVLFLVAKDTGELLPSKINAFLGTGNNQGSVVPPQGTLDAPWIVGTGNIIGADLVTSPLIIELDVNQPDVPWTANIGDKITGQAVLTGYKPDSNVLRQTVPLTSTNTYQVKQGDTTVLLKFDNGPFQADGGWDSQKDYPYKEGMAYFTYTVLPASGNANDTLSSQVFQAVLNTADQSFKAKLKAKSA